MPFFVFFGWLSDRIGRKWIIMAGLLLAVLTYLPIYKAMQSVAGSNVVFSAARGICRGAHIKSFAEYEEIYNEARRRKSRRILGFGRRKSALVQKMGHGFEWERAARRMVRRRQNQRFL
jgi:hypothetical protein